MHVHGMSWTDLLSAPICEAQEQMHERGILMHTNTARSSIKGKITACALAAITACAIAPGMALAADTHDVSWHRLAGDDAYGTMEKVVDAGWEESDVVVIATFDGYWDALSASALAGAQGAPVLLTSGDSLSNETRMTIDSLHAKIAYVCGGKAAISENVVKSLSDMGLTVYRRAGANAAGTAVSIAKAVSKHSDTCIVATDNGYWDALAASPYAYANRTPIFLTEGEGKTLGSDTLNAIKEGGFKRAIIVGGPAAVSDNVEGTLRKTVSTVERKWGQNAYETADKFARFALDEGMSADKMGIATTNGYWDALTGAALCGKSGSVLLLADDNSSENAVELVSAKKGEMKDGYVFGGIKAVGSKTYGKLVNATKGAPNPGGSSSSSSAAPTDPASSGSSSAETPSKVDEAAQIVADALSKAFELINEGETSRERVIEKLAEAGIDIAKLDAETKQELIGIIDNAIESLKNGSESGNGGGDILPSAIEKAFEYLQQDPSMTPGELRKKLEDDGFSEDAIQKAVASQASELADRASKAVSGYLADNDITVESMRDRLADAGFTPEQVRDAMASLTPEQGKQAVEKARKYMEDQGITPDKIASAVADATPDQVKDSIAQARDALEEAGFTPEQIRDAASKIDADALKDVAEQAGIDTAQAQQAIDQVREGLEDAGVTPDQIREAMSGLNADTATQALEQFRKGLEDSGVTPEAVENALSGIDTESFGKLLEAANIPSVQLPDGADADPSTLLEGVDTSAVDDLVSRLSGGRVDDLSSLLNIRAS